MPTTLRYCAPDWIDKLLLRLTAVPPEPLSLSDAMFLYQETHLHTREVFHHEEFAWDSLCTLIPQPWASYYLSEENLQDKNEYSWMIVCPVRHNIQLTSTQCYPIYLDATQHQNWFNLLSNYLPKQDGWSVIYQKPYVIVGLNLKCYPEIESCGALEHHPLWLRAKTELEMSLFAQTQQGQNWNGANGIITKGSGAFQTFDIWSSEKWGLWISKDPFWHAMAKHYDIKIGSLGTGVNFKVHKNNAIWVDMPSLSPDEQLSIWSDGLSAWQRGYIDRIVVSSRFHSYHYMFEIPQWKMIKRFLYPHYVKFHLQYKPWTATRVMSEILSIA